MYNYSIIIPFRGSVSLLEIACRSIPVRDDIQVLVIDNSDRLIGQDIIASFNNPNIVYLTSDSSKGAGCARNVGLANATGLFLLFLDADDYFTANAFDVFDNYLDSDYDIVFFTSKSRKCNSGVPSNRHITINNIIKNAIESGNEDELRYKFCNPVSKMIRRELITKHNILFQEVPAANDQMFSVWSGHYAKTIKAVDAVVYMINEGGRNSSLTKTKSLRNQESRFMVAIDHYLFVNSCGKPNMSYNIISFIIHGYLDFGPFVGTRWLVYALRNKVNLLKMNK